MGRAQEMSAICRVLDELASGGSSTRIFVIYGCAGSGKSALLRMVVQAALARRIDVVERDRIGTRAQRRPIPEVLDDLRPAVSTRAARPMLVTLDGLDEHDFGDPAERHALLGMLEAGTIAVLVERGTPCLGWKTEPGWGSLIVPLRLSPLAPAEAAVYLEARGVPVAAHRAIIDFARGNPLALALFADAQLRSPEPLIRLDEAGDLLATLCAHLVREIPDADHAAALDVATILRSTTESDLADLVSPARARELFTWLNSTSFMEAGVHGIHPHELARDIFDRTFAWRDPKGRERLRVRAQACATKGPALAPPDVFDTFAQLGHLVPANSDARDVLLVPPQFDAFPTTATEDDMTEIVAMTMLHEGELSARLVERWWAVAHEGFRVLRGSRGEGLGFVVVAFLDSLPRAALADDPVLAAVQEACGRFFRGNVRGRISLVRYWIGKANYQAPGPVTAALSAMTVSAVVVDDVALTFNVIANGDALRVAIDHVGAKKVASMKVGVHDAALVVVDRRGLTAQEWVASLPVLPGAGSAIRPKRALLDRDTFDAAVRDALRALDLPDRLVRNALLATPLLDESSAPAADLRALIAESMERVTGSPGRALRAAYAERSCSHEEAAESIGLPYSTFRRHVARGVEQVADDLWRRDGAPRAK